MVGTYAALAVILGASALVGQGLFVACGRREWSWLAPAVGLGVLCATAWGAVNITGEPEWGLAVGALLAAAGLALCFRVGVRAVEGVHAGLAVVAGATVLASLPFIVEGRFGILGTSLNPDMSQHLFAADRLVSGAEERLIAEGYPLGPHAIVVSVAELGPSLVQAFGGLTLAIAVAAALAPLAVLERLPTARRISAALLVGLAYMTSSYLIQGAFKETLQALFVLAFAIALHQLADGSLAGRAPTSRWRILAAVPLGALAVGSTYAYSFPGLSWIAGALGVWVVVEVLARRSLAGLRAAAAPALVAAAVVLAALAPELGRVADFASFETFDPDGPGLGNLFNPISPLEALGIWPSGDFRLDPGAGFAPSAAFWLGAAVGLVALGYGLLWWLRRGESAVPAALLAAALLFLYALVAGTPYQEAKAIAIAAPLAMLVSVRALFSEAAPVAALRRAPARALAMPALALAFGLPAAACSVLALANGPVGPGEWSPQLIELRQSGELGPGGETGSDTLVVAPAGLLVDERGEDLYLWELRGGNVCAAATGSDPPPGIENVVSTEGSYRFTVTSPPVVPARRPACPFIADGARADPSSG